MGALECGENGGQSWGIEAWLNGDAKVIELDEDVSWCGGLGGDGGEFGKLDRWGMGRFLAKALGPVAECAQDEAILGTEGFGAEAAALPFGDTLLPFGGFVHALKMSGRRRGFKGGVRAAHTHQNM